MKLAFTISISTPLKDMASIQTLPAYPECLLNRQGLPVSHMFMVFHTYALISGHPGGLTLGTYGEIADDLRTFVANFWPWMGALDHFCTPEVRYTGKDPRDL